MLKSNAESACQRRKENDRDHKYKLVQIKQVREDRERLVQENLATLRFEQVQRREISNLQLLLEIIYHSRL